MFPFCKNYCEKKFPISAIKPTTSKIVNEIGWERRSYLSPCHAPCLVAHLIPGRASGGHYFWQQHNRDNHPSAWLTSTRIGPRLQTTLSDSTIFLLESILTISNTYIFNALNCQRITRNCQRVNKKMTRIIQESSREPDKVLGKTFLAAWHRRRQKIINLVLTSRV